MRAVVCGFAIVVSVVFRILDFRTTELINLCQDTGEKLAESRGFFGDLNRLRFPNKDSEKCWRAMLKRETLVSYGFAINLLVASVIGARAAGLVINWLKWVGWTCGGKLWWSVIAALIAVALLVCFQCYTYKAWLRERDNRIIARNRGQTRRHPHQSAILHCPNKRELYPNR
jgi:hypothetical protein